MMVLIFDDTKNRRHTHKKKDSVGLECCSDWVVGYSRQQYSATTFGSSRIIIGSLIVQY